MIDRTTHCRTYAGLHKADRFNSFYVGKDKRTKGYKQPACSRSVITVTESKGPAGDETKKSYRTIVTNKLSIENNFQRDSDCKIVTYENILVFFGLHYMSVV